MTPVASSLGLVGRLLTTGKKNLFKCLLYSLRFEQIDTGVRGREGGEDKKNSGANERGTFVQKGEGGAA